MVVPVAMEVQYLAKYHLLSIWSKVNFWGTMLEEMVEHCMRKDQ